MQLVTFTQGRRKRVGSLVDGEVYVSFWPDPMQSLIKRGITPNFSAEHFSLEDVKLEPPLRPGKIIAIGRNYAEYAL